MGELHWPKLSIAGPILRIGHAKEDAYMYYSSYMYNLPEQYACCEDLDLIH